MSWGDTFKEAGNWIKETASDIVKVVTDVYNKVKEWFNEEVVGRIKQVCEWFKEENIANKPQLVTDGKIYINNSNSYKNCPDTVKNKIKSKTFTAKEKKEINEVIEKYKPLLKCKNHPLQKIARTDKAITKNGTCIAESDTMGEWLADQNALILTDSASTGLDFKDSSKQFRGTVAHEISHALMNNFDPRTCSTYKNELKNPLMQEYQKISGWDKTGTTLTETQKDKAPTDYAKTNPSEDLSEATMLYLYEPKTLKSQSPKRYEFLKKLFN